MLLWIFSSGCLACELIIINFRYNAFWLPLLARNTESGIFKGPLVVPLDCEWVWHCHRLNPVCFCAVLFQHIAVIDFIRTNYLGTKRCDSLFLLQVRYISDCKKFYGRILDNCNVVSSTEGFSARETEEIWKSLYPDEPYGFDPDTSCWDETFEKAADTEKHTTYDLVSAIERQSPFFYQVI